MRRVLCVMFFIACSMGVYAQKKNVLFIYDEDNQQVAPIKAWIENELKRHDIDFDETNIQNISSKDIQKYDGLVIYSMVMAFTTKSPIRTWLKGAKGLKDKKVALLVTANRWFLTKLANQQINLLKVQQAQVLDAVSSATKDMSESQKERMVRDFIDRVKNKL